MNQHHIPNFFFFFHKSKFHAHKICPYPQIYPCIYPQNFAMFIKQSLRMPTNFSTYIMNIFIQAYDTKFSKCQCFQNPSQNSSNNITNYQHCQNSISHQYCPSYTMINNKHFKNALKPTLQHDQSYNTSNSNKNTQRNDNFSPSNFQEPVD